MLINNNVIFKNERVHLHAFINNNPDYKGLSITDSIDKFKSHQISNKLNLYLSSDKEMSCVQSSSIEHCERSGSLFITNPEFITFQTGHPAIVKKYEYFNDIIIINSFTYEDKDYNPISEPSDIEPNFSLSRIKVNYYTEDLFLSRLELSSLLAVTNKEYPLNTKRLDLVKLFLQSNPSTGNIQKKEFFDLLTVFLSKYRNGMHSQCFNIAPSSFFDVLKTFPKGLLNFKSGKQTRVQKINLK